MTYKHHIIPRHAGGTDDPSNIEELGSLEEHAERHRILFETHGRWQDMVAWKALSGQIPYEEATRVAGILANTGRKVTKETKNKMSLSHKGNHNALGYKHTREQRMAQSNRNRARKYTRHSEAQNLAKSILMTGKKRGMYNKKPSLHVVRSV